MQVTLEHLLSQRGYTLLSHRDLKKVREEQALYQGGLSTDTSSAWQPILGARYILQLEIKKQRAILIDTHTGVRLGEVALDLNPLHVVNWIVLALKERGTVTSVTTSEHNALSYETSEIFSRAVRLYARGKPFEAFESFLFALRLSPSSSLIKEWVCTSLFASGFRDVGDHWRWCATSPQKEATQNDVSNKEIAFLGVVSEDNASVRYINALELILLEVLREQKSSVYVTEDLKSIQDEFDALVGVKRVLHYDRIMPGILEEAHTVVGSVHHNLKGQLVFTLFQDSQAVHELELPVDSQVWRGLLQDALKSLEDRSTSTSIKDTPREDLKNLWATLRDTYEREGGHIRSPVLPLKILSQESTQLGLIPYIALEGVSEIDRTHFKRMLYLKALPNVTDASLKRSIEGVLEASPQIVQLRAAPWEAPRFVRRGGDILLPSTPAADDKLSDQANQVCTMSVEQALKDISRIVWCAKHDPRYLTTVRSQEHLISAFFSLNKNDQRTAAYEILEIIKRARDEHNEPTDPEIYGNALYYLARLKLEDNDAIEAFDTAKEGIEWVKGKPFHLLISYGSFVDNRSLETHFSEFLNKMRDTKQERAQ